MKAVYTLADLDDRSTLDEGANKPAKLAVIGYPIKHSASPQMHQAALDALDINARYIRIEVEPGKVGEAFEKMHALSFIGCNVTVPHKLEAMSLCNHLTEDTKALGATNTIHFTDQGIIGHNTDGEGLSRAILADFGKPLSELRILLLGAGGGAGRAIATQCAREHCPALYLSNRTVDKLDPIIFQLETLSNNTEFHILSNNSTDLISAASQADLILNSTSLGLKENDPLPIPAKAITTSHLVYDAIYNPAETPLLAHATINGAHTSNGLSMLLHQGALAFEMWFEQAPNISLMQDALN